jgi:hypothetical protein
VHWNLRPQAGSVEVQVYRNLRPQALIFLALLFFISCGGRKEESPIIPPATLPLSRPVIGFAVINVSYTHLAEVPGSTASLGYLRKGSLVKVIERNFIKNGAVFESWVLVEGLSPGQKQGWLSEQVLDIYNNEYQAKTAAESISK